MHEHVCVIQRHTNAYTDARASTHTPRQRLSSAPLTESAVMRMANALSYRSYMQIDTYLCINARAHTHARRYICIPQQPLLGTLLAEFVAMRMTSEPACKCSRDAERESSADFC